MNHVHTFMHLQSIRIVFYGADNRIALISWGDDIPSYQMVILNNKGEIYALGLKRECWLTGSIEMPFYWELQAIYID